MLVAVFQFEIDMSYQEFWYRQSETVEAAIRAVDGSSDETTVQHTGIWTANQVAHALDLQATDRVLELGCGVGRIGKELAPRCSKWVGCDISPNMLKAAAHRLEGLPNISFRQLARSSFDGVFPDGKFDKAYSVAVFCHMDKEDLFLYLQDLYRIIRPGGVIYVETWNLAHPVGWRRWEHEVRNWSRLAAGSFVILRSLRSMLSTPALRCSRNTATAPGLKLLPQRIRTMNADRNCAHTWSGTPARLPTAKRFPGVLKKPWTCIMAISTSKACEPSWIR
jgi:SAM-dependent methyltransferase